MLNVDFQTFMHKFITDLLFNERVSASDSTEKIYFFMFGERCLKKGVLCKNDKLPTEISTGISTQT